eukprot:COSAG01_NODE_68102_length_265_cov_0.614458_1_plen_24_part_10
MQSKWHDRMARMVSSDRYRYLAYQ